MFGKAIRVIALILIPYFAAFIYLISGYSVTDEIERLERRKNAGTISNEEFIRLRAWVVR